MPGDKNRLRRRKVQVVTCPRTIRDFILAWATAEMVESIEVKWPSGSIQLLENIEAGQLITLKESESDSTMNLRKAILWGVYLIGIRTAEQLSDIMQQR